MVFPSEQEQIEKFEKDHVAQHYFEVLRTLISKKSVFAQQVGLKEVANVMAYFKSSRPDAKTLIFYNHYDTVPADGDQVWTEDPFTLSVRNGFMYGRGVDDDKGHITARLSALRKYMQRHDDLPVNISFIMEGAEESASTDLDKYLEKHADKLRGADLLVWEQGTKNALEQLEISGGNKGIVTFDAKVKSADVDIHSSYGGVVESAPWYLLQALQSLRAADGRILVEGLYEEVQEPNEREMALLETYGQRNPEEVSRIYGLELPLLQEDRMAFLKRFFFEPALNIEGIQSGYQGQGVKTILPAEASAKLEVRLVPGLEPHDVLEKIRKQLDKNGFDKVELYYTLGEMSYRSDMSAPAILNVIELAKKFYPQGVSVLPTTAGTGPMHTVFDALEVPMVAFGLGNANSRDHGGDENVRIADYYTHIELVEELIRSYE